MSESLSNLEIEPEWCSAVVLSSISGTAEPSGQRTAEAINPPEVVPIADPLPTVTSESEVTPITNPAPAKSIRSKTKSRPASKTSWHKKLPQTGRVQGLLVALQSRRARTVATVVSLVFVSGLIVLNWNGSSSDSRQDAADMDLAEFNDVSGLDHPRIGEVAEPQPLGVLSDAEPLSAGERFSQTASGPRLPPLGLVTHADHAASRTQIGRGVAPTSATFNGSRGAVLTGQIEFDLPQTSATMPGRLARNLGVR